MTHNAHDPVNSPAHYTEGRIYEVIDVLEDAVSRAPDPVLGALQWQTLKYLNRLWDKGNPEQDAQKAMWYLIRLVDKIAEQTADEPAPQAAWDTPEAPTQVEVDSVRNVTLCPEATETDAAFILTRFPLDGHPALPHRP